MKQIAEILLVTKPKNRQAADLAETVRQWCVGRGVSAAVLESNDDAIEVYARRSDAVVVFGGDGTLVGTCRRLAGQKAPVLGVNLGQVGFLAEISPKCWELRMEQLLRGELCVQPRDVLKWSVFRNGKVDLEGIAVNDVMVGRGALARLLPVCVSVDGHSLGSIRSDGILVSTPLGSTGYAFSAYGPLIHPNVRAMLITPVSSFFRSMPPVAISADSEVLMMPDVAYSEAFLTVDGQDGLELQQGDTVRISCSDQPLNFFAVDEDSYFRRLRDRGVTQCPRK
ncbi:MAG: NAD(+)/NADH kinase [Desulfovibrionaceae bacterium]|nr:NAD(+)/NADH kinase [Desulfovibrionaceae bacterium]